MTDTTIIAACGFSCSDCNAYKATLANDSAEIEKVAAAWSVQYNSDIKPESVWCTGCMTTGDQKCGHCSDCEIRLCAIAREIPNCAACEDYACDKVKSLFEMEPSAKDRLDALRG